MIVIPFPSWAGDADTAAEREVSIVSLAKSKIEIGYSLVIRCKLFSII